MSLSLAAHADEDWILVGAPNTVDVTVEYQMRTEGRAIFSRKDGHRYLQILFEWHVRSHTVFTWYGKS